MNEPSDEKYMLRLPPGMRQRIKLAAAKHCRSMNAEIIFHLEKIFPAEEAATKE